MAAIIHVGLVLDLEYIGRIAHHVSKVIIDKYLKRIEDANVCWGFMMKEIQGVQVLKTNLLSRVPL
jgi:hypothetical protein